MKIKPIEHAEFHLVQMKETPHCIRHGAMNKITPDGIWRCVTVAGYETVNENGAKGKVHKENICRAGCHEVKEMRKIHFADDLERMVGESLFEAGITFLHETEGSELDFWLTKMHVHIEVKRYYTDRVMGQISKMKNVILLVGVDSVKQFCNLLKQSNGTNSNKKQND